MISPHEEPEGQEEEDDDDDPEQAALMNTVPLETEANRIHTALRAIRSKLDRPDSNLTAEFDSLKSIGTREKCEAAYQNRSRNRYTNVLPYDRTRVHLAVLPGDDNITYINANHVRLEGGNYVAAQGPLPGTCEDFWRMIWQLDSRIIVTTTNEVEGERTKCARYWPVSWWRR